MASYTYMHVLALTVVAVVVAAPPSEAALSCGTVAQSLSPCANYLQSGGSGAVPGGCCNGIKSLNGAAQTTADRQAVCGCLKSAARAMPTVNVGLANSLPTKCGVHIPYKLDPTTDCSKVQGAVSKQ